jgi:hypothetical protein
VEDFGDIQQTDYIAVFITDGLQVLQNDTISQLSSFLYAFVLTFVIAKLTKCLKCFSTINCNA